MLKKIFINIMIIIMISSLSICATEVVEPDVPTDTTQSENNEDVPKNENTTDDNKDESNNPSTDTSEDKPNTNNNTNNNNDDDDDNDDDKTSSNKNNGSTTSKGQSTAKKTSTTKEKSKDANLKELKIDVEGMTPEFDKDVTEYYLTVNLEVEQIKVTATPADEKAKTTIAGNKKLKEGQNTITITVKAEDGTSKKYYIYVTKVNNIDKANAELKSLKIVNYDLSPKFKANIYNYNLNIEKDIQSLEVIAEAEKEKAKVEIEGNTNLKEGENIIKINVTAEDGETIRTYKINTYISSEKVEIKQENKMTGVILLVIVGSAIVGLGSFLIWKKLH